MYWKIHRQLFATSEQRIALLNETGPMVFYVLQHLLLDEVTLPICRLTDPAATGRRENHSFERLVAGVQDQELSAKLTPMLEAVRQLAQPFRDRRNRAIAHSYLETKLKLEANPLPGISREMVERTLEQIRNLRWDFNLKEWRETGSSSRVSRMMRRSIRWFRATSMANSSVNADARERASVQRCTTQQCRANRCTSPLTGAGCLQRYAAP